MVDFLHQTSETQALRSSACALPVGGTKKKCEACDNVFAESDSDGETSCFGERRATKQASNNSLSHPKPLKSLPGLAYEIRACGLGFHWLAVQLCYPNSGLVHPFPPLFLSEISMFWRLGPARLALGYLVLRLCHLALDMAGYMGSIP